MKRIASMAARGAEVSGALRLLEAAAPGSARLLRVLTYHRVADPATRPAGYPGLISATPEGFEDQVEALSSRYRVVSLRDVLAAHRGAASLPRNALLFTFDDATRDFAEFAWPALRRRGLPATLFVPTAFPDQPGRCFWWDRLYHSLATTGRVEPLDTAVGMLPVATHEERFETFKRLRDLAKTLPHDEAMGLIERVCDDLGDAAEHNDVLGWDQLRTLASEGVSLAAHSRTHPLMSRIPPDRIRDEAVGSLRDLERQIGPTPPVFAYPSGDYDERVIDVIGREGFELAFTTRRGVNDLRRDHPLRLRRINVGSPTSPALLRSQMLPVVGRIQRWWLPTDTRP